MVFFLLRLRHPLVVSRLTFGYRGAPCASGIAMGGFLFAYVCVIGLPVTVDPSLYLLCLPALGWWPAAHRKGRGIRYLRDEERWLAFCRARSTVSTTIVASGKKTDISKQGLNSIKDEVVKANLMGVSRKMKDKNWTDSQGRKGKVCHPPLL